MARKNIKQPRTKTTGASQKQSAQTRRPWLHASKFEEAWEYEEIGKKYAKRGAAASYTEAFERKRRELFERIEDDTKALNWSNERLTLFARLIVEYRRQPSIENYVRVRRQFPEVDIQVSQLGGIEALATLKDEFKRVGINTHLALAFLGADEDTTDALCLHLLELLIARAKLPKDCPGHIEKRRNAINDSTVNYLIAQMLEGFDGQKTSRVPTSLVVLIRYQLCGFRPDLDEKALSKVKRYTAGRMVGHQLKPAETLSINKVVKLIGAPRSTAARLIADRDFKRGLEHGLKFVADGSSNRILGQ
jgi:hypothetical protein